MFQFNGRGDGDSLDIDLGDFENSDYIDASLRYGEKLL